MKCILCLFDILVTFKHNYLIVIRSYDKNSNNNNNSNTMIIIIIVTKTIIIMIIN